MKLSREEILKINPDFTAFIINLQQSFRPYPFEEGDKVLGEDFNLKGDANGTNILTQSQAEILNKQQNKEFEENCDKSPFANSVNLDFKGSKLVVSCKEKTVDYLNDISDLLENIAVKLDFGDALILGVQNTPWLYQDNDFPPVKMALQYLKSQIDSKFDGGFRLKGKSLKEFIPHLFWLTRCNASLPYFYIAFERSKTFVNICKYGVLHIDFYNDQEKSEISKLIANQNFREVELCNDPIQFGNYEERRIVV